MIHIQNRLRVPREQLSKEALPLKLGPVSRVAVVQPQQVEGIEAKGPRRRINGCWPGSCSSGSGSDVTLVVNLLQSLC